MDLLMMDAPLHVWGWILTIIGAGILYLLRRKQAYRITRYGTERFDSFEHRIWLRLFEPVVGFLGKSLLLLGLLLLVVAWCNSGKAAQRGKASAKNEAMMRR